LDRGLKEYFAFYNEERLHQSLATRPTPLNLRRYLS
jgi:hypothetical protein